MAYRLKFSARALRETGEAKEWYELQSPGLGAEFPVQQPYSYQGEEVLYTGRLP